MTARARAASIFQTIADAVDSGLAAPIAVNVFSPETGNFRSSSFQVRVGDNEVDQLAEWTEWLGMGAVVPGTLHRGESGVLWRSHRATAMWQGWQAEVWARVDEPADTAPAACPCLLTDEQRRQIPSDLAGMADAIYKRISTPELRSKFALDFQAADDGPWTDLTHTFNVYMSWVSCNTDASFVARGAKLADLVRAA